MNIDDLCRTDPRWNILWRLFGAYLNQDLDDIYGDPWVATAEFRTVATSAQIQEAAHAARTLATQSVDDAQAERAAKQLGLEYNPTGDGYTYRDWLLELADFLESDP